jgi:hypothetical protein
MNCEEHFADVGYLDLYPLAQEIARKMGGYTEDEMTEAAGLTFFKERVFPPQKNRRKWFEVVYAEKLEEARAEITRFYYEKLRALRRAEAEQDRADKLGVSVERLRELELAVPF